MSRTDPAVMVKGTGAAGLGDLIRALLAGLHYARVTGRGLIACWDDGLYGPMGENVFSRLLRLTGIVSPHGADLDPNDVAPSAWRGRLHLPLGRVYALERADDWDRAWALDHLSFDQTRYDHPQATLVMWDFDRLSAAWAAADPSVRLGVSPDAAQRLLARRHLRPALEVLEGVQAIHAQFDRRMIGVHVRKTFEQGGASRHLDQTTVFAILDRLVGDDGVGIFLATDNRDVEMAFRERYPRVVSASKWFGTPGIALHFDVQAPDKTQLAIEALVDLYLLAACDALLHPAESSFSRVAAVIGDIPPSCVFALPPGPLTWQRRLRAAAWVWRTLNGSATRATSPYFLQP